MRIRVGSRESALAVRQSQLVMDSILQSGSGFVPQLVTMKTTGDRILDRSLDKIGGKGLFVKELDQALLEGRVDLTVHSLKDMPMETDPRLPVVAFSLREDPRDALILPVGRTTAELSGPIGCSSARRKIQLEQIFPGCEVRPLRGNIVTRLEKLDRGEYGAIVLAYAGLKRMDLQGRAGRIFTVEEMLPAAGQGILAVQARADFDTGFLSAVNSAEARDCALAERAFVRRLGGGCSSPVAAYATLSGSLLTLRGMYVTDGGILVKRSIQGAGAQGEKLGAELADALMNEFGTKG